MRQRRGSHVIPPPHPKLALNVSVFLRKSINEKANFSNGTKRMLEIQTLALQITDKVPVFLFLFIWHSGSNIPCWCFTNSTLTWRERNRRGWRTGNRSPVSEDSVASFQMCKTMNFKSTVFHPTIGHCPQQWGIFTWSLKQKRKRKAPAELEKCSPLFGATCDNTQVTGYWGTTALCGGQGWLADLCVYAHVPKSLTG